MPDRRQPPAAVGKPSFAYFPVDYLLHDVWRPDEPTDFRERYLLDATPYERSEDNDITLRNPRNNAIHLASLGLFFPGCATYLTKYDTFMAKIVARAR